MQLFAGELTNQNREYYKVNANITYSDGLRGTPTDLRYKDVVCLMSTVHCLSLHIYMGMYVFQHSLTANKKRVCLWSELWISC